MGPLVTILGMIVLAVDPGTVAVGWAVFSVTRPGKADLTSYDTFRPRAKDWLDRCQEVTRFFGSMALTPDRIVVERPFIRFGAAAQGQSIAKLCTSVGCIFAAFPAIPWAEHSGHATKGRAMLVARSYGIMPADLSDHAADAISLGADWIRRRGLFA